MKALKIATLILTIISALMITLSGVMKLMLAEAVVNTLTPMGLAPYIQILGVMEIVFAALFIFNKTRKIGFILLSCYFGGAIATELAYGGSYLNAAFPLVLVWISAFLNDRSIFLPSETK
jgi:hypothetical protein